ncbi:MAG: hypothetical protein V1763_00855, partial [Parcubacteria group bacterium]
MKKLSLLALIAFILIQISGVILIFPQTATATMPVTAPVLEGQGVKNIIDKITTETKDKFLETLKKSLILSASITLRNTMVQMARTAAEQTMTGLTTGDWGQSPMFYTSTFEQMGKDLASNTAGAFIDSLHGAIGDNLGFDICMPPADVQLNINLSLSQQYRDKDKTGPSYKPNCSLSTLTNNWEVFADNVQQRFSSLKNAAGAVSIAVMQETMAGSLSQKGSDVGAFLTLQDELEKKTQAKVTAELQQRQSNGEAKAVTTINGGIKTPSFLTKGAFTNQVTEMQKTGGDEIAAAGNVLESIPESVVSAFLTTFVSKGFTDFMNKKLFQKGLVQNPEAYNPSTGSYNNLAQF